MADVRMLGFEVVGNEIPFKAICPRCGKTSMIKSPAVKIAQEFTFKVFGFTFRFPIFLQAHVEYDPSCGYLAIKQ